MNTQPAEISRSTETDLTAGCVNPYEPLRRQMVAWAVNEIRRSEAPGKGGRRGNSDNPGQEATCRWQS